jgi:Ring finger domain
MAEEDDEACQEDLEAQLSDVNLDGDDNTNDDVPTPYNNDGGVDSDVFMDACGTCPVCIEDFVIDEMVVILPRCKHAYHKECVRQWLMEKQGICPLCKTNVLDAAQIRKRANRRNNTNNNNVSSSSSGPEQPQQQRPAFYYYQNNPLVNSPGTISNI